MSPRIALVVTYFDNPRMLVRQLAEWARYPPHVAEHFRFVIVDDGSQWYPAVDPLMIAGYSCILPHVSLFRIDTDIPWNQHGARNLAARECVEPWLLMLDIDHVLTAENAERLAASPDVRIGTGRYFKFPRERIGAADETRTKDATLRGIPPDVSGVTVNPAMNCFLTTREAYWQTGGYNEDFCGCYGGDTQFLTELRRAAGEPVTLNDVWLQVHTRHSVPDANERHLDRSPEEFRRRLAVARRNGTVRGHEPYCRFRMAPRPLDSQARRVYVMERRELWGHLDHTCALGLLRCAAHRATRLHGVPSVTISIRRHRGAGGWYEFDHIELDPDCGRNLLMLAHELAHHITHHRHPHAQDHGPAWMRWYAHLLAAWRLVPIEGTIAACRRYGVAIAPVVKRTLPI